ncbi:MAG: cytochrome c biogenesis protein CcsA [Actinobacteria bacterium]|nr:cytochrome c biogenesis protein CcsA [Actinomycetota bacterium]
MNETTASPATRVLGLVTAAGFAALLAFALVLSPADQVQGELVRIMYVHVPTALVAFVAFGVTVAASVGYLVRRTEWWDLVAHASAEIGAVLLAATLVTGMLWGRPTWGVYWTWDARLTTTALLFVLALGYLAVRRLPVERERRTRLAAVVGLLFGPTGVVVRYATEWWNTLHQKSTITTLDPKIDGLMLFTLMLGFAVFALLYVWLMIHRFRVLFLEHRVEDLALDEAIAERRAEAASASASASATGARPPVGAAS